MKIISEKKSLNGFTLVELLIAMTLFVIFVSVLIGAYADIIRSQKGANDYREIYSQARVFFDEITADIRDFVVYYDNEVSGFNSGFSSLILISKDGKISKRYFEENGQIKVKENIGCGQKLNEYVLNSDDIEVSELSFYVTPALDPYSEVNVPFNSLQFQPKVTLYSRFKLKGEAPEIDFQTTISSRFYGSVPKIDFTCIN